MLLDKILKNTTFGMVSQMVLLVFGFIGQRAMNLYMGAELVGMNSVISNIIAVISVTEMGLATAVSYHLYGALAADDRPKVTALMAFYRRSYFIIGAVIGILGIAVLPVLPLVMRHGSYETSYVRVLYLLWLLRSVLPYYLTYKRTLLIADQQGYRVSLATIAANIANYSLLTIIVTKTQNYLLALTLNIAIDVLIDVIINAHIDRRYPYLNATVPDAIGSALAVLRKDLKNVFVAKVSNTLLLCTDNLLISGFVSVTAVGLFNNYSLITRTVSNILTELATAIQPSVGHLMVREDYESDYHVLRLLSFAFFCGLAAASCGLYALIDPFIADLWLDKTFQMARPDVLLSIAVIIIQGMGLPLSIVMGASGLFKQERNLSLLTAAVNILVSLALVVPFGIAGVLWGTILSYAIQVVYRSYVFFSQYTHFSAKRYWMDLIEYTALLLVEIALTGRLVAFIYHGSPAGFLLAGVLCITVPTALNLVLFSRSWRLRSIWKAVLPKVKGDH